MPARDLLINGVVEGDIDAAVFRRLVKEVGARSGPVFGRNGKGQILKKLAGFNEAARRSPWVVLVDLDSDADCAPPLIAKTLPTPSQLMRFRIVVREIEAWVMGDRERLAQFLHVNLSMVPTNPEDLEDPKKHLVEIASRSSDADIRVDLVPRRGSGREVGPAYKSRLVEFISKPTRGWRPRVAARQSESLDRCIRPLASLVKDARARAR